MGGLRAWAFAWAGAAAIVFVCSPSMGADEAGRGAVDVVVVGSEAEAKPMRAVAEELLSRLGVDEAITFAARVDPAEVINPRAGAEPRVARAWIDLSRPDRATLYLVDREWERVLIRHLRKTPGHEELAREAMGHILENAVDALLHGARIGVVREEARRELEEARSPAPPPDGSAPPSAAVPPEAATPPPPSQRLGLEWGALYEAELYADGGVITHGPAATLVVGPREGTLRPALWLTLQYRLPLQIDAQPLGVRLDAGAARALAAVDAEVGKRVALRFGVGGGVDAIHMTPLTESGLQVNRAIDQTFAVVVARSSAGLAYALSPRIAIVSVVSCDLDLSGTRYVSVVDGSPTAALSPWTLRPALSIGVDVR
jgi:hypothetical protein